MMSRAIALRAGRGPPVTSPTSYAESSFPVANSMHDLLADRGKLVGSPANDSAGVRVAREDGRAHAG